MSKFDGADGIAKHLATIADISGSQIYKWGKVLRIVDYFNSEALCRACETNIKKPNQIVCDECHAKCEPEEI